MYKLDDLAIQFFVVIAVLTAANIALKPENKIPAHIHVTVPIQNPYIKNSGSCFNKYKTEKKKEKNTRKNLLMKNKKK